jgi:hypothetical protein
MDQRHITANHGHDNNIVDLNISDTDDDSSIEVVFVKTPRHLRLRSGSPEALSSDDTHHNMPDTIDLVSISKETIDLMDSSDEDTVEFSQPASNSSNLGISQLPLRETCGVSRKTVPKPTVRGTPGSIAVKKNYYSPPKPTHSCNSNFTTETSTGKYDEDDDNLPTPSPKKSSISQATNSSSKRAAPNAHLESDMRPTRMLRSKAPPTGKLSETRSLRPRSSITPHRSPPLQSLETKPLSRVGFSTSAKKLWFDASTPPLKSDVASTSKSGADDSTDDEDCRLFNHHANEADRKRAAPDDLRTQRVAKRRFVRAKSTSAAERTLRPRKTQVVYVDSGQAGTDIEGKLDGKPPAKVTKPANISETMTNKGITENSSSKHGFTMSPKIKGEPNNIDDENGSTAESMDDDSERSPEQMFLRNWAHLQEPVIWQYKCPALANSSLGEHGNLSYPEFGWSRKIATIHTKLIDHHLMICGGESRFFAPRYRRRKYQDLVQWVPMRGTNQPIDKSDTSIRSTYCSIYTYRDDTIRGSVPFTVSMTDVRRPDVESTTLLRPTDSKK